MEQYVLKNKPLKYARGADGLSLVEVIIALTIFLIVFMGVLQAALLGIDMNMHNILRDEAITIAAGRMEEMRSLPFANIVSDSASLPSGVDCPATFTTGNQIQRNIRNMTKDFCLNLNCQELGGDNDCSTNDSDNRQIHIRVTWKWKGEDFVHSVTTLRRND